MMIEAVKTTASAGEIWGICVVAVLTLAFWLSMVAWADRNPLYKHRQVPEMTGPVLGGMHVADFGGRSVSPNRDAPAVFEPEEIAAEEHQYAMAAGPAPLSRAAAPETGGAPGAQMPRVPAQGRRTMGQPAATSSGQADTGQADTGQAGAVPAMPAQRTADADQPEHTASGPGSADQRGDLR